MRISSLEIDKFATLRDLNIREISPKLTVIYGDNESGKTSLMEFIRSTMFESKSRTRYPQPESTDVGRMFLRLDDGTPLRIIRKGNRIENMDGGLLPSQILHAMDLQTFENIFAMGLENLMDHKKIVDDDNLKSRFLTVAGTKNLIPFRKECEKELDSLLGKRKTKDSNKIIDNTMAELEKTHRALQELQATVDRHEKIIKEIEIKLSERLLFENEKKDLRSKLIKYQNAQDQRRNKEFLDELQINLEPLKYSSDFPANGLQKFSDLSKDHFIYESEQNKLKEELIFIETESNSFTVPSVMAHSEKILALLEKKSEYRQYRNQSGTLREQIIELNQRQDNDVSRLGWESLSPFDAVITMEVEERARETLQSLEDLKGRLMRIEAKIDSSRNYLEADEINDLDQSEMVRSLTRLKELILKKQFKEQEHESNRKRHVQQFKTFSFICALAFAVGLMGAVSGYFSPGVAIMILATLTYGVNWYLHKKSSDSDTPPDIHYLEDEFSREASRWGLSMNPQEIDVLLDKNLTEWRIQNQSARMSASHKASIAEWQKETDHINACILEAEAKWSSWISMRGFPKNTTPAGLERIIPLINSILQRAQQIGKLQQLLDKGTEFCQNFCDELSNLSEELDLPSAPAEQQIEFLQVELNEARESIKEMDRKRKRGLELKIEIPIVQARIDSKKTEISNLISISPDESSFLKMGEDHQKFIMLQSRYQNIMSTMMASLKGKDGYIETTELIEAFPEQDLQIEIESIEFKIENLEQKLKNLDTEMGKLEAERDLMRTQEGLSQLSQTIEFQQSEMERLSKRYAQIVISLYVLNKACDAFMHEKQPAVIEKANGYLDMMTYGRYRMVLNPENMQVQVHDGLDSKNDGQWSSGLGDQIHLSLRLAMAEQMSEKEFLPIILDDILVRFDSCRRRGAVSAIRQLASKRQVLMFTCDRQVERLFRESDMGDTGFLNLVHGSVTTHDESVVIGR